MRVEWKNEKVGAICDVARGTTITRKDATEGDIPVVAGGLEPTYYHNVANRPAGVISISGSGANAGFVNYWQVPIFASDCSTVIPRDPTRLDSRFVYLALKEQQDFIYDQLRQGAAQPHVYAKDIAELNILVPPLDEQQRIVSVLDEAFESIATAKANAEQNLRNARALFESQLQAVFNRRGEGWVERRLSEVAKDFGRGRSRHRPRNDPALYGGKYPFIQTGDVRNSEHLITSYSQTYNEVGLAQSKLWPAGTLCITIAANIAETGVLSFDACFPDSVIGVVVSEELTSSKYVEYMLQSYKTRLQAEGKGSAQDNINLGTFESQKFPFPSLAEQSTIISNIDALRDGTQRLESIYERKIAALDELKKSLLHRAFSGELTTSEPKVIPISTAAEKREKQADRRLSTTDRHAGILALAYRAHERAGKLPYFGHVKAEKIAHMVEARTGIDLGREPVKDAAGPNDYPHLKKVEHRARNARFFDFKREAEGERYTVAVLPGFDRLIDRTREDLGERYDDVVRLIDLMLPMDTTQAEIIATVYAAWNNLLLDGLTPTDEEIVHAAREDWHPSKLKIDRDRFFRAIAWMREQGLTPTGTGKRVARRTGARS